MPRTAGERAGGGPGLFRSGVRCVYQSRDGFGFVMDRIRSHFPFLLLQDRCAGCSGPVIDPPFATA